MTNARLGLCFPSTTCSKPFSDSEGLKRHASKGSCLSTRLAQRRFGGALTGLLLVCTSGTAIAQASTDPGTGSAPTNYNPMGLDAVRTMHYIQHPADDLVIVSAHRGIHRGPDDNDTSTTPENSLDAISQAAASGIEQIELDVKLDSRGIPVLSHDSTWGRTTDYRYDTNAIPLFNPDSNASLNEANNPRVDSLPLPERNCLRTNYQQNIPVNCQHPLTLEAALRHMMMIGAQMVIALDIRDATIARAAWNVVANTTDNLGQTRVQSTLFKIPAKAIRGLDVIQSTFPRIRGEDYLTVNFQPVFNTGDVANDVFGSEIGMWQQLQSYWSWGMNVAAVEIQVKENDWLLSDFMKLSRNKPNGALQSRSIFSPYADKWDESHNALFFKTDGHCCVRLSDFFYKPTAPDRGDRDDKRGDPAFIIGQGVNAVTRDDAVAFAQVLGSLGKRNLCRISDQACGTGSTLGKTKIMVVGDSISEGQQGDFTWRYRLSQWLASQNVSVDFVGPYMGTVQPIDAHGPQPDAVWNGSSASAPAQLKVDGGYAVQSDGSRISFDSDHFAVWGRQVAQDMSQIQDQVRVYQPDMVLVELGFNDVGWFVSDGEGTLSSMKKLIDNARIAKPDVKFVIANIPHRTHINGRDDLIANTNYYNSVLPSRLSQWATTQSPIVMADFQKEYGCDPQSTTCASTYDGLHPNELGEFRIARAFEVALHDGFKMGGSVPDVPSSVPPRNLATPSNLRFDGTLQGATIFFDPVYGAYSYDIGYRERPPGGTWGDWHEDESTSFNRFDKSWQFDNRPYAGWDYEMRARARAGDGRTSAWSNVVGGTAIPTTSAPPSDLTVTPVTAGLNISWRAPTGSYSDTVYQYAVWLVDKDVPGSFANVRDYTGTSALFDGLVSGHHYSVLVEAWNKSGPSHPAIVGPYMAN